MRAVVRALQGCPAIPHMRRAVPLPALDLEAPDPAKKLEAIPAAKQTALISQQGITSQNGGEKRWGHS